MEEELNEHELEERLYAMLHHVDQTQKDIDDTQNENNVKQLIANAPRSTVRRYWHIGPEYNPYQKINTPKEAPVVVTNNNVSTTNNAKAIDTRPSVDLTILQSPVIPNSKPTIEIIEQEVTPQVLLESSDEDEVVEVALPPKPTITIESSDEDEIQIVKDDSPVKTKNKGTNGERAVSASPVPSVVSSVSDEFIRSDCIALNISSRQTDKPSFDFSLHGSDLMQDTPKKKKKKKSKEAVTSTPANSQNNSVVDKSDGCFATPKSKAKNKKQKTFLNKTVEKIPSADIYDSDSNQSIVTMNKNKNHYIVTNTSLPSADVYESDSNQSEIAKESTVSLSTGNIIDSSSPVSSPLIPEVSSQQNFIGDKSYVDLTASDDFIGFNESDICESIVMGNVTGFSEMEDLTEDIDIPSNNISKDISRYISSKVPSILFEDLDFDNLKGNNSICQRRRYSLKTLRVEMEKFYNESWGGEDFNHKEIQKNMSRDKSLWAIDPKDKMPSLPRKIKCGYCGRLGHRDDTCRMKPPICYMCGNIGHMEPRCPKKICFNCGAPNHNYTQLCRNCAGWGRVKCNECGQFGHPASHCPDLWRRYHNTIELNMPLEKCSQTKTYNTMFCSGCSRKGHFIHTCRTTIPFSGHPINSPYVFVYRPIYGPIQEYKQNKQLHFPQNNETSPASPQRNKRQSKSPIVHETHSNKKRSMSLSEGDSRRFTKSPINTVKDPSSNENIDENSKKTANKPSQPQTNNTNKTTGKVSDVSINSSSSSNHDNKGQIIQDNEVSDTSDVITTARIYITNDLVEKLKTKEGKEWLANTSKKLQVTVNTTDITSFLNIKGKIGNQEAFQLELREWNTSNSENENSTTDERNDASADENGITNCIVPRSRSNLLKILEKALKSLKEDLGDPKSMYKQLTFNQNRHQKLLKQKVISPQALSNSRTRINGILKKLNIILLGQAGLADGQMHLKELYSLKEKIANNRHKYVALDLRKEIDEHYKRIFGSTERNDYLDLLNKYYVSKRSQPTFNVKAKQRNFPRNFNAYNNKPSIPSNENMHSFQNNMNNKAFPRPQPNKPTQQNNIRSNAFNMQQNAERQKAVQLDRLKVYHKQLLNARPCNVNHKKARGELIRKLHTLIGCLLNQNVPSKTMKKVMRTQREVQNLLTNM